CSASCYVRLRALGCTLAKFGSGEEGRRMLSITWPLAAAALCAGVGLFAFCPTASADEGFGGFGLSHRTGRTATSLACKTHCSHQEAIVPAREVPSIPPWAFRVATANTLFLQVK